MSKHKFERNLGGEVILDMCFPCQGIWFDENENLQITPGGIIELFRLIHNNRDAQRQPLTNNLRCPRCDDRLLHGLDMSKFGGRFNYDRCLQHHGRFTTFGQFMIEKGFVRQLNPAEIHALAAKIGVIHCSGCGAPVDIRKNQACDHCKAAITILDPEAVEKALARFQQAESKRSAPPDFNILADALIMQEREKSRQQRERRQQGLFERADEGVDAGDLLIGGIGFILGLLN